MKLIIAHSEPSGVDLRKQVVVVGRDAGCDIVIAHNDVSHRHARFYWKAGRLFIEDLESTNGTRVNGRQLRHPREVKPGTRITFAGVKAEVHGDSTANRGMLKHRLNLPLPPGLIWGAAGVLAAVILTGILHFFMTPERPRLVGGGSPGVLSSSKIPVSGYSDPQKILSGGQESYVPGLSRELNVPASSDSEDVLDSNELPAGHPEITILVPENVQARRSANPRPWKDVRLPAEPLPVQITDQLPQWLGKLGLKPEWFDGFQFSLKDGSFRAALSNEALEKLPMLFEAFLQANNSSTGFEALVQPASFPMEINRAGLNNTLPLRPVSYSTGGLRTEPYIEIVGRMEPGTTLRLYGIMALRPPDVPDMRHEYGWVEHNEPVVYDLFISQERLIWGEMKADRISIGDPGYKTYINLSSFDLRLADWPFSFPFQGACFQAGLESVYLRDSEYELTIGPVKMAMKTSQSDIFSGWAWTGDIGEVVLKKDDVVTMHFDGAKLRGYPRAASGDKVAMGASIRLGAITTASSLGLPELWSKFELNIHVTGPRAQWMALYDMNSQITAWDQLDIFHGKEKQFSPKVIELHNRLLDLAGSGLEINYNIKCLQSTGELNFATRITWPEDIYRYKSTQQALDGLFETARVQICAESPEQTIRQWTALAGWNNYVDQALTSGELTQSSTGRLRWAFRKDSKGITMGDAGGLCGKTELLTPVATFQEKKSKPEDVLFPVYGPDGRTYYVSIRSNLGGDTYAGSSPFLNIIEDGSTLSIPGQIDPMIGIEGLTIHGPDRSTALTWEEARPIIIKSLFLMPALFETSPPSDFEIHELPGGEMFFIPSAFSYIVSDEWVQHYDKRRSMYAKVFLDLFTAETFYHQAMEAGVELDKAWTGSFLATWIARGDVLDQMALLTDSAEMTAWISAVQRAEFGVFAGKVHGQMIDTSDFRTAIGKVESRVGEKAKALEWIALGLGAAQAFENTSAKTAIMTKAAQLSMHQAQAETVIELLRNTSHCDPALLQGAEDAMVLMKLLEKERFNAFVEGVKSAGTYLGGVAVKKLIAKGAAHALAKVPFLNPAKLPVGALGGGVSGLITVGIDTWKTSRRVGYLGCLATAGRVITSGTSQLIEGQSVGGIAPPEANLTALMRFNHQVAYLAFRKLNEELYHDRPLSKVIPYGAKDLWNWGLKKSLLSSEDQLLNVLLMETTVDAALPELIAEIKYKYSPASGETPEFSRHSNQALVSLKDIVGIWHFSGNTMHLSENGYTISGHGMRSRVPFQLNDIDGRTIILRLLDSKMADGGKLMKVRVNEGGDSIMMQSYFGEMDEWRRIR